MSNASKFADAVLVWIGMELLSPEWNAAFRAFSLRSKTQILRLSARIKKLWADFPLQMMVARHKHGMKPADHFDAAVAQFERDKKRSRQIQLRHARMQR